MAEAVFKALADPTRRALFEQLALGEMTVAALTAELTISQPAVSQHLATLRDAGLVVTRREGRNSYYRANPDGLVPMVDWVDRYRTFWPRKLDKLRSVLKGMKP
jgi:DNA-binding transcriptional ArsR family regulator